MVLIILQKWEFTIWHADFCDLNMLSFVRVLVTDQEKFINWRKECIFKNPAIHVCVFKFRSYTVR